MSTEQVTLEGLEQSLMNASSVREAEKIVASLDKDTLTDLYYHVKAFTRKKTLINMRKSIVECTLLSYRRHLAVSGSMKNSVSNVLPSWVSGDTNGLR